MHRGTSFRIQICVWQTVRKLWVFELTTTVSANEISSFGSRAIRDNPVTRFRAHVIACCQWQYGHRRSIRKIARFSAIISPHDTIAHLIVILLLA